MNKTENSKSGFTIIEVVLVLAIAGLIFLIVFIALPQLQQSRRDTQRRGDLTRMTATVDDFASNNNGRYPSTLDLTPGSDIVVWATAYINNEEFSDPSSGNTYFSEVEVHPFFNANDSTAVSNLTPGALIIAVNTNCDADGISAGPEPKSVVFVMKLEQGQACRESSN